MCCSQHCPGEDYFSLQAWQMCVYKSSEKRVFALVKPISFWHINEGENLMLSQCKARIYLKINTSLYQKNTSIRVRYAETDQMGVVYYGIYPQYFEVGRVESLRSLGFPYRKLEEDGVMLPVRSLEVQYKASALYDELLQVRTIIPELPSTRIQFLHEIMNEAGTCITTGKVELVFVNAKSRRPRRPPENLLKALSPFYQ